VLLVLAGCVVPDREEDDAWPQPASTRPVVELDYSVSDDLDAVVGAMDVDFTPDLPVCELVFRAWANKPTSAWDGSALAVTEVVVDGQDVAPVVHSAGAPQGAPGTLILVPLPRCLDAGVAINAALDFTVTLGRGANERVGVSVDGTVAWFAGAFPMLAWEDGRGWATEPAVSIPGETATSETFFLRSLTVTAPARYQVLGTGTALASTVSQDGSGTPLVTHHLQAPAVREASVSVGLLDVVSRDVDGVTLHVGVPSAGSRADADEWADHVQRSMQQIAALLGPFPYRTMWVSVLPDRNASIEMSGAVQFADVDPARNRWLIQHEVAHMWFYGLVGNNQARDPWLDEAFATMVQRMVDDTGPTRGYPARAAGRVGEPMSYWDTRWGSSYVNGVYLAGGDALLRAREQVGSEEFDTALQRYLTDNAHEIAVPSDVTESFADLPEVLDILQDAGALP
jgi:hypothetical protein